MTAPNSQEALKIMQEWVEEYRHDIPCRVAHTAAIAAMDKLLAALHHGIDGVVVKAALDETHRMLEILQAFQGRLSILNCQINGVNDEFDEA